MSSLRHKSKNYHIQLIKFDGKAALDHNTLKLTEPKTNRHVWSNTLKEFIRNAFNFASIKPQDSQEKIYLFYIERIFNCSKHVQLYRLHNLVWKCPITTSRFRSHESSVFFPSNADDICLIGGDEISKEPTHTHSCWWHLLETTSNTVELFAVLLIRLFSYQMRQEFSFLPCSTSSHSFQLFCTIYANACPFSYNTQSSSNLLT